MMLKYTTIEQSKRFVNLKAYYENGAYHLERMTVETFIPDPAVKSDMRWSVTDLQCLDVFITSNKLALQLRKLRYLC